MSANPATPLHPVLAPLALLLAAGRALVAAVAQVVARAAPAAILPRAYAAHPATAQTRIARSFEWIEALARTLAGDRHFLLPICYPRFPGRYPALTAQLRAEIGLPPVPARTEAQRAASRLHTIRKVFARDATGVIAARLARRLGLTPADRAWPSELIPLTATPAALAEARARTTKPPVQSAAPVPTPADTAPAPPAPAFHKRE